VSNLAATALSGGTRTAVTLTVDYATDPKASPTFQSDTGTAPTLLPTDPRGDEDRGYHWQSVPVRERAPGVAIRVRQTGNSAKTAIHSLGVEVIEASTYRKA
jgi:hypothetical protein